MSQEFLRGWERAAAEVDEMPAAFFVLGHRIAGYLLQQLTVYLVTEGHVSMKCHTLENADEEY